MKDCLKDVEEAFRAHQEGKTVTPVRIALSAGTGEAATLYMPSFVEPARSMGIKIVSVFPDNPKRGRPAIQGITLLTDAENGNHLALMDATYLTVRSEERRVGKECRCQRTPEPATQRRRWER